MRVLLLIAFTLACVTANDDAEYVKSVKGGHSGYRQYNPAAKLPNFYGNSTHGYGGYYGIRQNATQQGFNTTAQRNYEIGVCYIEVPTVNLVHNQAHVPRGNGSRPELSRIRSCCKGYIRNIHNFRICDPVCSQDCVNALCTAPETCTCFPDHVKNLAGFCIPTCPIGCQNGHCSGGECLCKEGFKLDSESKYCLPNCRENCGGLGNCTAPNTCNCNKGYQATPDGNCKPACDKCINGECIAPNQCRCKPGYVTDQPGNCIPQCDNNCAPNGRCVAPGKCEFPQIQSTTPAISPPYQPSYHHNMPLYPANQVNPTINTGNVNSTKPASFYPGQTVSGQQGYNGYPGNEKYPGGQGYPGSPGYPGGQGYVNGQGNVSGQGYAGGHIYPPASSNGQGIPTDNQVNVDGQKHTYPPSGGLSGNQGYPIYPGNQVHPGQSNPGNQGYPVYPGNQVHPGQSNPGNQGYPVYPGNQIYPGQSNPGNQGNSENKYGAGYLNTSSYQGSHGQENFSGSQGQINQNQIYPDIQQYNQDFQVECSQPCLNGYCVEGNRCRCNNGYVLDKTDVTETRCIPHCPGGCNNGVCSSPNFCICNVGYYKDHSVKGRPQCVKRNKRSLSADDKVPNIANLLVVELPDY